MSNAPDPRIVNHCDGFTRSQAIRRALASGARPVAREWDSRMPIPAGVGIDRRRFIAGAIGGLALVYGAERAGLTDGMLGDGIARAATQQPSNSPIIVSLFLQGGLDSLSLLAPAGDPLYEKLRPTLAVAPGSGAQLREDTSLTWHPAAQSLATLHNAGKVLVFPGIGYADEDMSHFTSRHYWEVGTTDASLTTGWMGRYLDLTGDAANPFQGLSLDGQMNPTIATAKNPVAAIDQPNNFAVWVNGVWGDVQEWALESASSLGDLQRHSADAAIKQVAGAASEVGVVRRTLTPWSKDETSSSTTNAASVYGPSVSYPASTTDDLPARLAGLASMIHAGVPLKCVALTTDVQFDTHSSQATTFETGVQLVSDSLAAFQADLEARGVDNRVLVHVWSEFGRRALENGSDGTDHGAAGTSLLIGSRVNGGMIGEFPTLDRLDVNGNQVVNVDFRGVYASLLEQWFDHDAGAIIPAAHRFPRYQLLA
ncbi:MAG TPA: DUF1501 domain-containing protein [Solirubrobacteraceae bacterium]|nr:DUF1501 domain-containing protein [Solirubrobacteraceae bacterium]